MSVYAYVLQGHWVSILPSHSSTLHYPGDQAAADWWAEEERRCLEAVAAVARHWAVAEVERSLRTGPHRALALRYPVAVGPAVLQRSIAGSTEHN